MARTQVTTGLVAIALFGAMAPAMAQAEDLATPEALAPPARILDRAGLLSEEFEESIAAALQNIEERTSLSMVVMTVPSLMGATPESVADGMLNKWKETVSARSTGLLLLAPRERTFTVQIRMPVDIESYEGRDDAYWFEKGVLPPSYMARVKSVIEPAVVPYFRKEDWEGGIGAAIDAVNGIIENAPSGVSEDESPPST